MISFKADAVAVSLSGLCLVHCLALPVLGSILPLTSAVAEAEWLHRALVMLAVPVALLAFASTRQTLARWIFGSVATLGSMLLVAGAFVEPWHALETQLTVAGACCLAGAHLYRWRQHQH